VVSLLSDPAAYASMGPRARGSELDAARKSLALVQAEHAELTDALKHGRISVMLASAAEPAILERMRAAGARVAELEQPAAVSGLGLGAGADIAQRWERAPLAARRAVIRTLFASVKITPAGRGRVLTAAQRCEIERAG
jgi:hypothetical protein